MAQPGGGWRIIGPGGGGAQYIPTISPHDPNHVLVACDMTGDYLSKDGGASWRMFNLGEGTREFIWDPKNPEVLYARGNGLYRSEDGGRPWGRGEPGGPATIERANDHADVDYLIDHKPAPRMTAMAVDPSDSNVLLAGLGTGFFLSRDRGVTWKKELDLPTAAKRVWAAGGTLYVAMDRSVWSRRQGQWSEGVVRAEAWRDVAAAGEVVYAVEPGGGVVSSDGGRSWDEVKLPGSGAQLTAVAVSRDFPDTAYAGFRRLRLGERTLFGVVRTTDRGKNWELVWSQDTTAPPNVTDAWITPKLGADWGDEPLSLGVAPSNPDICYATDLGRTLRTTNGGKSWQAVYSRPAPNGWTTTGLDVTTAYGVHFDPFDSKRILISYTDIGPFLSEDGGQGWISVNDGIPRAWINTTYWMVFDPKVRGRVWGVASGTHDLPRPKMWRRRTPDRYRGGAIQSADGGRTWKASSQGMPETAATHIVLDPKSPVNARVLYVAAFGRGVYKSTDGGANWTLKNNGIQQANPFAWRLEQDGRGALYVVLARASEDGSIGNSGDGAVYFSADGAETWKPVQLPAGVNGPNGITADARRPDRLYLSAWCRKGESAQGSGGIYVSDDGGKSWRHTLTSDQHIYDVTLDPRVDGLAYACGFESTAWRSLDGGGAWSRIPGYNFKWGHRVIPDPTSRLKVYITTFGGSVWHGPVPIVSSGGQRQIK